MSPFVISVTVSPISSTVFTFSLGCPSIHWHYPPPRPWFWSSGFPNDLSLLTDQSWDPAELFKWLVSISKLPSCCKDPCDQVHASEACWHGAKTISSTPYLFLFFLISPSCGLNSIFLFQLLKLNPCFFSFQDLLLPNINILGYQFLSTTSVRPTSFRLFFLPKIQ